MVVYSNGKGSTGSVGRWGDGEMGSVGEIKKYISSPLPCRTTHKNIEVRTQNVPVEYFMIEVVARLD